MCISHDRNCRMKSQTKLMQLHSLNTLLLYITELMQLLSLKLWVHCYYTLLGNLALIIGLFAPHICFFLLSFSVKCGNKSVKNSYFTVCKPCADQQQICGKCGQKEDLVSLYVFYLFIYYLLIIMWNMIEGLSEEQHNSGNLNFEKTWKNDSVRYTWINQVW